MHPSLQAIADRRLGVFTSREAQAAGHSVDEIKVALRTREWTRLRKGVYVSTTRVAAADARGRHLLDCVAVALSLSPGPVLSHASAARLHGLVAPESAGAEVRVTDVEQWRTGRGYRVARAALPTGDVVPWMTFGATSIPRTRVDCAREWPLMDAVIALDAALQARLVDRAAVQQAVHSARHRAGASAAARALGLSDGRAESPLETRGRLALLAAGLPVPELQVELHDDRGFVARLDGWYEEAAVALEFDGRVKYLDPRGGRTAGEVLWDEKRREDRIRALDVRVVRVADEDLGRRWPAVVAAIAGWLERPLRTPRRFTVVRRAEPGSASAAA